MENSKSRASNEEWQRVAGGGVGRTGIAGRAGVKRQEKGRGLYVKPGNVWCATGSDGGGTGNRRRGLGGVEANLEGLGTEVVVLLLGQGGVAQGFEQTLGEVAGGTETAGESGGHQAALFHKLHEQVGDLH